MITVEQAWELICSHMPQWPAAMVPLRHAAGCVLRQQVVADRDQPPFHRVTMDGIAVSYDAVRRGRRDFTIQGIQAAGTPPQRLDAASNCFEVMTGAVLPEHCDCVIPVERISVSADVASLEPGYQPKSRQFIHRQGSDYPVNHTLLTAGAVLNSPEIAVLASVGCAEVKVSARPVVTVVSTGDELVTPGQPVLPYQIRMANDYSIASALRTRGYPDVQQLHLKDDPTLIREQLVAALKQSDVLVISGGVSKGKFDYLPDALAELNVRKLFHRVQQRPGKPMWFGLTESDKPVFALPGNPVSALVCFYRYVLPAMSQAEGRVVIPEYAELTVDLSFRDGLAHFVPAVLATQGAVLKATPKELNTSGDFFGLAGSHGLIELSEKQTHCPAGTVAPLYRW